METENNTQGQDQHKAHDSGTAAPIQSILKSMSERWDAISDIKNWHRNEVLETQVEQKHHLQEQEREKKRLQEQRDNPEKILMAWGIPAKHIRCSFDNFIGGDKAKEACIESSKKLKSVILYGSTGSGKTHLAVAMLRRKVLASETVFEMPSYRGIFSGLPDVEFITVPELLLKIRSSYSNKSEETEEELVDRYSKIGLLILDDLGSERPTEWAESTLYLIIDRRNRDEKWTIVTSNLSLDDIEQKLGARIASRLADMQVIKLSLPDYRKKRQGKQN